MTDTCELVRALLPGGPVRMPLRICCAAALTDRRARAGTEGSQGGFCPAEEALTAVVSPALVPAPGTGAQP